MVENRFNTEIMVNYYGIEPGLTVSFPGLMSLLQEASLRHTDSTPHPMKWYSDNGFGFLLTNWHVRVDKYPSLHDNVTVRTWPTYFKGILSERYFEMRDDKNNISARAAAKWVFMDLNKKRACKPPEEIVKGYGNAYEPEFERRFEVTSAKNEFEFESRDYFTITRSGIDSNNHVNNVKYIEWAVDYIPDEIYDSFRIKEAKVSYKKECLKGERVYFETFVKNGAAPEILSVLKPEGEPDAVLFEANFIF